MNLITAPNTMREKSYSLIAQPLILTQVTSCHFHTGNAEVKEFKSYSSK